MKRCSPLRCATQEKHLLPATFPLPISYQYIEVNPYDKPASLLKLNPRGLVPTLSYQNEPLYESNVICEFLEDAFPDHGPRLLPNDAYQKARCKIWMDFVTTRIIPGFHRFLQWQPSDSAPPIDGVRKEFLGTLREFAEAMMEKDGEGPWFGGKKIGMVDLVLAPWALRLWVFDYFKDGGLSVPAEGEEGDDAIWKRWRGWVKAVEGRKSVQETMSEKEKYLPIYKP
ncbi:MAG: hypothetical protein LQ338_007421 [Usnochroma carphineum]|nr:MAG: hypothetical protein LQ338_007421 [Usnochroma carphineum]